MGGRGVNLRFNRQDLTVNCGEIVTGLSWTWRIDSLSHFDMN